MNILFTRKTEDNFSAGKDPRRGDSVRDTSLQSRHPTTMTTTTMIMLPGHRRGRAMVRKKIMSMFLHFNMAGGDVALYDIDFGTWANENSRTRKQYNWLCTREGGKGKRCVLCEVIATDE